MNNSSPEQIARITQTFLKMKKFNIATPQQAYNEDGDQQERVTMSRVSVYLNFMGKTEEAFEFYKSVFGTEYQDTIMRMGDCRTTLRGIASNGSFRSKNRSIPRRAIARPATRLNWPPTLLSKLR